MYAGVALIAKCCVNIAFFECRMHFSHFAASLYAKWQHWWPPLHSTLDLPANWVSSQPCKSSQWRAESRRNERVGCLNFWSIRRRWLLFTPKISSMRLVIDSALSVNKMFILFRKTKLINLKPNPMNLWNPMNQIWKKVGLCIRLARNRVFCQADQ